MLISSKIIDRVLKYKGFKTDVKLAKFWRVTPTAITNWRNRNSIPFKKIITFCEDEGVCLDYIFTGEGEITHNPEKEMYVAEETPIYKGEILDDLEKQVRKMERELEILKSMFADLAVENAELKKRLNEKKCPEEKTAAA